MASGSTSRPNWRRARQICSARAPAIVQQAKTTDRLEAEDDVLCHGEHRDEHEVLVHHADPAPDGIPGVGKVDRLVVEADLARVGSQSPNSTFISVDLPAPFSPRRQWTSPSRTSRFTPSTATNEPNLLVMPANSSLMGVRGDLRGPRPSRAGTSLGRELRGWSSPAPTGRNGWWPPRPGQRKGVASTCPVRVRVYRDVAGDDPGLEGGKLRLHLRRHLRVEVVEG